MDIDKLLIEISKNFLSNDLVNNKNNLYICLRDATEKYKVNIEDPNTLVNKEINLDTDLCVEIDLEEAIKLSEGKNNVGNSLFNGSIKLIGNLEVLNNIASDIEKTT